MNEESCDVCEFEPYNTDVMAYGVLPCCCDGIPEMLEDYLY